MKKMRVDARRTERNLVVRSALKTALRKARATKKFVDVSAAYSALDRAVKLNLVHKNFANRQKSSLGKLAKPIALEEKKVVKKVVKKTARTPAGKSKRKAASH